METPKNTMYRDENGNIREGVKWYFEFNDILTKFFGNECGYYRGFQKVSLGKDYRSHVCLGGVFELDIDKQPTQEFFDFIKEYKSEHIKGIVYQKEVEMYGRTMYRNAVIALL